MSINQALPPGDLPDLNVVDLMRHAFLAPVPARTALAAGRETQMAAREEIVPMKTTVVATSGDRGEQAASCCLTITDKKPPSVCSSLRMSFSGSYSEIVPVCVKGSVPRRGTCNQTSALPQVRSAVLSRLAK